MDLMKSDKKSISHQNIKPNSVKISIKRDIALMVTVANFSIVHFSKQSFNFRIKTSTMHY